MEGELYILLNQLVNPKKIGLLLSVVMLVLFPATLEIFLIVFYMKDQYSSEMIFTIESSSVAVGYIYVYCLVKWRIKKSLRHYRKKEIFRLIGSLPSLLYLLSPGLISLVLGYLLLLPFISSLIGQKIVKGSRIDPSVIYSLLELNSSR